MSRGKRYEGKPQLNYKRIFAVLICIAVIIMIIASITQSVKKERKYGTKIKSKLLYSICRERR